jgi:O-succinylbenzoic acid--CoA ligase
MANHPGSLPIASSIAPTPPFSVRVENKIYNPTGFPVIDSMCASQQSGTPSPDDLSEAALEGGWLQILERRSGEPWIQGLDGGALLDLAQRHTATLRDRAPRALGYPPRVLLAEGDPVALLAGITATIAAEWDGFMVGAEQSDREWRRTVDLVRPDWLWGRLGSPHDRPVVPLPGDRTGPRLAIATGGSTGQLRFAVHTPQTLRAAVAGFRAHFATAFPAGKIHSYGTLPLHHVSGFMPWLRSLLSGGTFTWGNLEQPPPGFDPSETVLSLVPTQLARLLRQGDRLDWLAQFKIVLLGGGPAWPDLLDAARSHRIPLAPTYGATETAAQVATLHPADFLAGATGVGPALPHAQIDILDERDRPVPPGTTGQIVLSAPSLALGYYPAPRNANTDASGFRGDRFYSGDLGYWSLDPDRIHRLHLVGRQSDKIITGGEKVFPAEVEAVIQGLPWVRDVAVVGVNNAEWGQAIAAFCVLDPTAPNHWIAQLAAHCRTQLSAYKCPKQWHRVPQLPRNSRGKLQRDQLG